MARSYTLRGLTAANGLALVNVWCRAYNATSDALVETAYTDSSGEASFSALPDDANVNICCIPGVKGDQVTWLYNIFSAAQDLSYGEIITQSAQIKDAIITSAKIGTLDASKITSGYISVDRLDATVAYISATAMIANAIITDAKIGTLDASKITSGYISVDRLDATVAYISATAMIANAIITDAKIGTLDAAKITAGDIATARLQVNAANAVNAGGVTISGAKIELTSATTKTGEWYNQGGVTIDATKGINIYGLANALTTRATKAGTIQCYVGVDGKLYAGAGAVVLDSVGIKVYGQLLYLYYGATNVGALGAAGSTSLILGSNYDIVIQAGSGRTIVIGTSGTTYQLNLDTVFYPYTTNTVDLGRSDRKWKDVYGRIFRPTHDANGGIIMGTVAKAETGSYKYSWNGSLLTMAIYCGGSWHHIS